MILINKRGAVGPDDKRGRQMEKRAYVQQPLVWELGPDMFDLDLKLV